MSKHREELMRTLEARALGIGLTVRELRDVTGPLAPTTALGAALEHREGTLLLLGPPGTGKTLAATCWLLSPLLEIRNWEHENGRWFTPRHHTLVWRTAKSLQRVKQYEGRDLEVLFNARRLVLDDMGQEFLDKAGFLSSLVDELVTERHRRGRATVMTANLNVHEFTERYGERVFDRVRGEGRIVVCDEESLRGAALKPTIPHALAGKDVAARARECAERQQREADERHQAWLAAQVAGPPAPTHSLPPEPRMEGEALARRKVEIARQLEAWTEKNGGTTS